MTYNILLEESIMQKGIPATAGSKMLGNFIAPFDATVVTKLSCTGTQISGRLSMGEFGVEGLFFEQPKALTESVSSFANSSADAVLCNDYTGAICKAAAAEGLYYIHPTYGTVSRYGLIPAVTSMDQIGVLCKDLNTGFEILEKMVQGKMVQGDGSTVPLSHALAKDFKDTTSTLLPYYDIYPQIMQILCSGELAGNISRYDGIKFGYRANNYNDLNELYTKSRTQAFGENIKLAAIIGAMVLSKDNYMPYYDKAMRLRRLIKQSFNFNDYTVITATAEQEDRFPVLSRLCGLPAITTPERTYIANAGCDKLLIEELLKNEV